MNTFHRKKGNVLATMVLAIAVAGLAPDASMAAEADEEIMLEEVTVTARKREQSLQDVSLTVATIDGATLDALGISNFDRLEMPGVHIGQGGDTDTLFVRGIGSVALGRGVEQSVPIYVDGVYYGRGRQQRLAFLDIERLEVLKGPQPTYLGKNAIGGAVSITSRRPTDVFEASLESSYEFNYGELSIMGAASGPISDQFRIRGVVKYRNGDGWLKNTGIGGRDGPKQEDTLARLSAEWDVSDSVQVFAKIDYANVKNSGTRPRQRYDCDAILIDMGFWDPSVEDCVLNRSAALTFNPAEFPQALFSDRGLNQQANQNADLELDHFGGQVIVNWDIGEYSFESNSAYYEYDLYNFDKIDAGTASIVIGELPEDFSQFSQEFRLTSPFGERLEWMAGLYYDSHDFTTASAAHIQTFGVSIDRALDQDAESWAVFGELAYQIADPFTVRFAGRYSEVKKEASYFNDLYLIFPDLSLFGPVISFGYSDRTRTDSDFQPAVTFEWQASDDHMFYASWKEGFKAGGFDNNADNILNAEFEPETVTAYEIGAKLLFFNNAVRLNLSAFSADYSDLQVNIWNPETISFSTQNAGESQTRGFEVDFAWAISQELTFSANGVLLDSYYVDFPDARCFSHPAQTVEEGCDLATGLQNLGEHIGPAGNKLAGQQLPFAPDWSATFSLDYHKPLDMSAFGSTLAFSSRLGLFITDDFYAATATRDPDFIQDSYAKLDLILGIGSQDGRWEAAFIGKNLTNELTSHFKEDTVGEFATSNSAFLDLPRELGIRFRYNFR